MGGGGGVVQRPLNNDVISARFALDTTPAGAEVNKTSVEVESFFLISFFISFRFYPDFKFKFSLIILLCFRC